MKISSLLVRPEQNPIESAQGYVLRLADLNGLRHSRWLFAHLGIKPFAIAAMCPLCLAENSVWRRAWLDRRRPWCPDHRCWLVDGCTVCGQALRWVHLRRAQCACGAVLAETAVLPAPADLMRFIDIDPAATEALLWLGAIAQFGIQGKPWKCCAHERVAERAHMLCTGWAMNANWPAAFFECLDHQRQNSRPMSAQLLSDAFPAVMRQVQRIKAAPWRA